jgi:RNA-directed DNA polymerase
LNQLPGLQRQKDLASIAVKLRQPWPTALIQEGTRREAKTLRDQCRDFLEGKLKLTLTIEKTPTTVVNDGFVFLGYRIIRRCAPKGNMRVVAAILSHRATLILRWPLSVVPS